MKLYIKMVNGVSEGYPIIHDNFIQAYPEVDTDDLPEEFALFIQGDYPTDLSVYEKCQENTELINGVVYKTYLKINMTAEEIKEKQDLYKSLVSPPFPSWEFSEEHCAYMPPPPEPDSINDPKGWHQDELPFIHEWDSINKVWTKRQ